MHCTSSLHLCVMAHTMFYLHSERFAERVQPPSVHDMMIIYLGFWVLITGEAFFYSFIKRASTPKDRRKRFIFFISL